MAGIYAVCSGLLLMSDTKNWVTQLRSITLHLCPCFFSARLCGTSQAGLSSARSSGGGGQLAPCCFPVVAQLCGQGWKDRDVCPVQEHICSDDSSETVCPRAEAEAVPFARLGVLGERFG